MPRKLLPSLLRNATSLRREAKAARVSWKFRLAHEIPLPRHAQRRGRCIVCKGETHRLVGQGLAPAGCEYAKVKLCSLPRHAQRRGRDAERVIAWREAYKVYLSLQFLRPGDRQIDPAGVVRIGGAVSAVAEPKTVSARGEDVHFKRYSRLLQCARHHEAVLHRYALIGKGVPQKSRGVFQLYVLPLSALRLGR